MNLFFDIETLPSLAPDARATARAAVRPPATHKKPETIAAWWQTEGEQAAESAYRKQALDAASGELCAIGFADDNMTPVSLVRNRDEPEAAFLKRALSAIDTLIATWSATGPDGALWPVEPFFIAHNAVFDLGFLRRRCWVNGIELPFSFPPPMARPGKDYGCTMTLWAGHRDTISLDRLCRALGVPSPKDDGMDGAQVLDRWLAGDYDSIERYNIADVAACRACWQRMTWSGGRRHAA